MFDNIEGRPSLKMAAILDVYLVSTGLYWKVQYIIQAIFGACINQVKYYYSNLLCQIVYYRTPSG